MNSRIDLDKILSELGQFGRYQIYNYSFILIPIILSGVYNGQYVFNAANVQYRCKVPECESTPPVFEAGSWSSWALPDDESLARCHRMVPLVNASCSPDSFHINATQKCDQWVYQTDHSIVPTFNLACQEWKRTLVGTMHSAGMFVALPLTGYVSDTFGRRTALVLTSVMAGVIGIIRSFSHNYTTYVLFEFLEAFLGSGVYSTGFILALEMVGLKHRVLGGNMMSSFYALGEVSLAVAAWAVPYWRNLTRMLYAPTLFIIFYFFIIEESVRWLLSKGKREEAAKIIYKVADMNNKIISPEYMKQLAGVADEKVERLKCADDVMNKEPALILQVLRSKIIMLRLSICSFWWITVTFIYFGLSINSVSLAGNSYVNYILTSLVEIPGYCLSVLTLDRFGRKCSIMSAFFVCGTSLVAFPFIPASLQWLSTALNMLGKLSISMTFSSIYIYTSELFPTTARHSLLGFCSMIGRIGSIVAPQTPLLMSIMASMPYLLFGVMAFAAGSLMLLTPDTLNVKLPDTIAQAENISKKNQMMNEMH